MSNLRKLIATLAVMAMALTTFTSPSWAGSGSQSQIVQAVNAIRQHNGLPPLQLHPSLQRAAAEQAKLMAQSGKMSHKVGYGHGFKARLKRAGFRGLAAENIAHGQKSLGRVLKGWLASPGHRRNMLHPRMRYFGLSAKKSGGGNYWAMVLGG